MGTYWRAWCQVKRAAWRKGSTRFERIIGRATAEALAGGGALFDVFEAYRKLRRFDEALALLDQTTWSRGSPLL